MIPKPAVYDGTPIVNRHVYESGCFCLHRGHLKSINHSDNRGSLFARSQFRYPIVLRDCRVRITAIWKGALFDASDVYCEPSGRGYTMFDGFYINDRQRFQLVLQMDDFHYFPNEVLSEDTTHGLPASTAKIVPVPITEFENRAAYSLFINQSDGKSALVAEARANFCVKQSVRSPIKLYGFDFPKDTSKLEYVPVPEGVIFQTSIASTPPPPPTADALPAPF